jgi:uncharacterized membrane protein
MAAAAGGLLALLATAALLVNLYFASIALGWSGVRSRLGRFFNACGAETSSCVIVFATPYARLFGGAPNVAAGIPWGLSLLGLAAYWIGTGRLVVPWPYLFVAAATLLVGAYLIYALVAVLKQPCPLCMTGHALHAAIAGLLAAVWWWGQRPRP